MVKTCLFGIFIFNRHFTLIYRFLSDDLFNYLYKRHRERLDSFEEANPVSKFSFLFSLTVNVRF